MVSCTSPPSDLPRQFRAESASMAVCWDTQKKAEEREIFGPFDADTGRTRVMHSSVGFTPTKVDHGSVPNPRRLPPLFTHAHDIWQSCRRAAGAGAHQEWLHSDYSKTNTRQSCHMPLVQVKRPSAHARLTSRGAPACFVGATLRPAYPEGPP